MTEPTKVAPPENVLTEPGINQWLIDVRKLLTDASTTGNSWLDRRVDEYIAQAAEASGTTIKLPLSVTGPWMLTSIVAVIPTGSTSATLLVDDRLIPVQMTPFVLSPVQMLLDPRSDISLTINGATGPVFIEAMGYETGSLL